MQKELRISDLALLLNVTPQAIRSYIKKGYLKAHKKDKHIYIYLEDYAQFLCDCPFFRRNFYAVFEQMTKDHIYYELASEVHSYISNHQLFYAVPDVACMCDVTVQAIQKWVSLGELKKDIDGKFFSKEELKRFFAVHPSITRWQKTAI